jgi:hypothetical protein
MCLALDVIDATTRCGVRIGTRIVARTRYREDAVDAVLD